MLDTIYAIVKSNGTIHAYSPTSPDTYDKMGSPDLGDLARVASEKAGVYFVPLPDYILREVWAHKDGKLDLIAEYVGPPCDAYGCQCEEMPYSIFLNGETGGQMASKDDVLKIKLAYVLGGSQRIDGNKESI